MSKKKKPKMVLQYSHVPKSGGCLLMTSLMLVAPSALVALVVKGARR